MAITYERACQAIDHIFAAAKADGLRPVCVAITDEHGDLVAFGRMEGAPVRSSTMATNKSYTAARLERDSDTWGKQIIDGSQSASWFGDPNYTGLPGGLVIKEGDHFLGGIGVSGRTGAEDKDLAALGLQALDS